MAKLIKSTLNQILKAQATEQIGAEPYERTEERQDSRNGYNSRNAVNLLPIIFRRYQRSEQALLLALMELVVNGVSTNKAEEITYQLCSTQFSKSTISELCKNLDPIRKGWNSRPLKGSGYFFVIVGARLIRLEETAGCASAAFC
ncbi:MAG: hypothetical protein PWQ91_1236 [Eubacteriales bacterium]|nr:hypothetical protein [Eubacteriales bacterium]